MQGEETTEGLEDAALPVETPDVEIKAVEDGTDFIRRRQAGGKQPLREVVIDGERFFVRKVGGHEVGEIFRAEFKTTTLNGEQKKEFDALATAIKMMVVTITKCIVKPDRASLWKEQEVLHMVSGPSAEIFGDIVPRLYQVCVEENPTLLPRNQPLAMKLLFEWF